MKESFTLTRFRFDVNCYALECGDAAEKFAFEALGGGVGLGEGHVFGETQLDRHVEVAGNLIGLDFEQSLFGHKLGQNRSNLRLMFGVRGFVGDEHVLAKRLKMGYQAGGLRPTFADALLELVGEGVSFAEGDLTVHLQMHLEGHTTL